MVIKQAITKRVIVFASIAFLAQGMAEPHAGQPERDSSYFQTRPWIDYSVLAEGFANPPQEARLRVWWFWHAGQATRQSIPQDLEAMKANGIGGALICDNGAKLADPPGPAFMSDGWK